MFKKPNHITNVLYCIAKLQYKSKNGKQYIDKAIELLVKEPQLSYTVACRNLWNLFALDHESKVGMDCFTQALLNTKPELIKPIDVASAMRSFAHFQYVNYDCIEVLLKITIRNTQDFKMQTLAVTINSLADLDITNPTLLLITK